MTRYIVNTSYYSVIQRPKLRNTMHVWKSPAQYYDIVCTFTTTIDCNNIFTYLTDLIVIGIVYDYPIRIFTVLKHSSYDTVLVLIMNG